MNSDAFQYQRERLVAFQLVAVTLCAWLPQLNEFPATANLFFGCAILLRLWLAFWRKPSTRPEPVFSLLALCAIGMAINTPLTDTMKLAAGAALLALGWQIVMLRNRRALQRALCLCAALLAFQLPGTQSVIDMAPVLLGAGLTLHMLVAANMHAVGDRHDAVDGSPARISLRLLAAAIPITIALFLFFPRLPTGLFGERVQAVTGMSDSMSPGSIAELSESGETAFVAVFSGPPPVVDQLYWRANVLGEFDGRTWRALDRPASDYAPGSAAETAWSGGMGRTTTYTLVMEPHNRRWVFALDGTTQVQALPGESGPLGLRTTATGTVESQQEIVQRAIFMAKMTRPSRLARASDDPPGRDYLTVPMRLNPRTIDLAVTLKASAGDPSPLGLSRSILAHFNQEPFYYSHKAPTLGRHAIDDFLFVTRRGFCEHYASAYVVLMRLMGVPARVVTGYHGGEPGPTGETIEVLQRNAHAWAEVWAGEQGWVRVDPTAAVAVNRVESGSRAGTGAATNWIGLLGLTDHPFGKWLTEAQRQMAVVNLTWKERVLQFNEASQTQAFSWLSGIEGRQKAWVLVGVLALLAALTIAAMALTVRRRTDALARTIACLEKAYAGHGPARHPSETVHAYLRRVNSGLPPAIAEEAQAIADEYAAARYGDRGNVEPRQLLRRAKALRRQLAR